MRRVRLCTCLGVLVALIATSAAQADPTPVERPATPGTVAPLAKPPPAKSVATTTSTPPTTRSSGTTSGTSTGTTGSSSGTTGTTGTGTSSGTVSSTPPATPTPVVALGGREPPQLVPAIAVAGHRGGPASLPTRIARLFPTRLAQADDALPSYDSWPSWVLAAFTLLATAEAFLLVRIARARRYANGQGLQH